MEPRLFRYIWQHTRRDQIWILAVILVSLPFYFMSLDLPKLIVNGPIQGRGFETATSTARFLDLKLSLPEFAGGGSITLFSGLELERLPYLVGLSLLFLALVCVNGAFKLYINTFKGRLGERMLRRLRFDLVDRVLRFPMHQFRRIKSAEVATMVKDEVEPLGGFIGDAYVQPVFLLGQALTTMVFIMVQSVWLGLIAIGIVLVQTFFIPKLRKRLLELGRRQQLTARDLAGRVAETVDGIAEIRVNDTSNYERADISGRLGKIFFIRYELYQRKFFIKFLNNFLAQLTPFLFFLIGGYYAITGTLDIGQLVAVIAAYKDLPGPIKELIDWDQQRQDVQIKYSQVVEQFATENLISPALQQPSKGPVTHLQDGVEVSSLTLVDETGAKLVESTDLKVAKGERVAALGEVNAGAESVAEAIVRLIAPASGRIRVGGRPLEELPESVTGRRIAYVGAETYLKNISLRECLLYGLARYPFVDRPGAASEIKSKAFARLEARASGNSLLEINADWTDYEAAGCKNAAELDGRILEVLKLVDLDEDVFELGLRSRIDPSSETDIAERVLQVRRAMIRKMSQSEFTQLVEPFDPSCYAKQATVAENIIFGAANVNSTLTADSLAQNAWMRALLWDTGLHQRLCDMGRQIASTVIELFSTLPPDHPFFDQMSFVKADNLPAYQAMLSRVPSGALDTISPADEVMVLGLAFAYVEPRYRLGLLDEETRSLIVAAREKVRTGLPEELKKAIAFYDVDSYNTASSLEDNMLFGRIVHGVADGARRVRQAIRDVLVELNMRAVVFDAGLGFNAGPGGRRLSAAQRQKIGLARALLKRPDILIANRALSSLSGRAQGVLLERILRAAKDLGDMALFVVLSDPHLVNHFDRVVEFRDGRVVFDGSPQDYNEKQSKLVAA
ncbi:MAG: ATP-binding cassette domain-containing protein [Hyphomicrobiaceae bacterium]|nr:MAG: ATP-binding cassette domain-containing protein [Hyphomicrobiaceae bacterium]